MKLFIIAVILHLAYYMVLDILHVNFSSVKNMPDWAFWLIQSVIFLPLYLKALLSIHDKKWLAGLLALIYFIIISLLSAVIMLLFHVYILKAPL